MLDGTMDKFSDLDLVLVYDSSYREDIMAERMQIAGKFGDLLSGFTGEHVGEPRLVICLYGPPALHVDLKFVTLSELEDRIENPLILWERNNEATSVFQRTVPVYPELDMQWIEDRFWVWVHYGAAKLGRGELFELIDLITFLRGSVLGPMIAKLNGRPSRGVRKLELFAAESMEPLIQTIPLHNSDSCYQSLLATIRLYKQLRGHFPNITLKNDAEAVSVEYLDHVYGSLSHFNQ